MKDNDKSGNKEYIFGTLMVITNRMDKLVERKLAPFDMTSKQWLLSAFTEKAFKSPPTIKEAAQLMGSSHQNVKQVALKLENKGFMELLRDKKDHRVTRLKLTEKSMKFWNEMDSTCSDFAEDVFQGMQEEELAILRNGIEKILGNISKMERETDEGGEE